MSLSLKQRIEEIDNNINLAQVKINEFEKQNRILFVKRSRFRRN